MEKTMGNKKTIAMFVLPAFIVYAVFALFPILYNVYLSLFDTDLMSGSTFVGLKNYIDLLHDTTFTHAFWNNILMVIGSLIAHLPLAGYVCIMV
ncbi:MAG: hypothetical protein SOI20_08175 [Eubacteriales bacterium]|jgi:raffinose/stachyose/melibiose transport system permease protein